MKQILSKEEILEASYGVVLFDGVCNLCNHTVDFLITQDNKKVLRYASLQSETGEMLASHFGISLERLRTILYVRRGKAYIESSAVLNILRDIGGLWALMYAFIIIPPFIRNAAYRFISRNRYRFFGKKNSCRLPSEEEEALFL